MVGNRREKISMDEADKKWIAMKVQVMARLNKERRLGQTKKQRILEIGFQRIFRNFRESGNEDENRVLGNKKFEEVQEMQETKEGFAKMMESGE